MKILTLAPAFLTLAFSGNALAIQTPDVMIKDLKPQPAVQHMDGCIGLMMQFTAESFKGGMDKLEKQVTAVFAVNLCKNLHEMTPFMDYIPTFDDHGNVRMTPRNP